MNPTLLALETSSSRCSVALLSGGAAGGRVASLEHDGAQEHAERLLPMARDLLRDAGLGPADLQVVAFGQGPGGFTGLRVACGVAQGIALAHDLQVVPIVSHLAVAAQVPARPDQAVVVALDARMGEVYLAAYRRRHGAADDTAWDVLHQPILIVAGEVVPWVEHQLAAWQSVIGLRLTPVLAGDAWEVLDGLMAPRADWIRFDALRPHARDVARLAAQAWRAGRTVAPEHAAPLYVRDRVAFTSAERAAGQGGNPKAVPALHGAAQVTPEAASETAPEAPVARSAASLSIDLAPITGADLDAMERIEAAVQAFPWTRRNFADALAAGYDGCGLRRGRQMVGFCILMHAPDVSHLLVIAVERDMHRQGLGTRLIDWCIEQTRQRGIEGLLLEVRPSNRSALAFYRRHGFRQVGLRRDYYPAGGGRREDAIVMRRPVAQVGNGNG